MSKSMFKIGDLLPAGLPHRHDPTADISRNIQCRTSNKVHKFYLVLSKALLEPIRNLGRKKSPGESLTLPSDHVWVPKRSSVHTRRRWKRRTSRLILMFPFLPQRFRERVHRRLEKNSKQVIHFAQSGPGREAIAAAVNLIKEFSDSEPDLARLLKRPLNAIPVTSALPEPLAQGWRSLYLSLDRVPRTLLIVPSLDEERLRRYLSCLCNHAIASGDAGALLVVALDEAFPSIGAHLPREVVWRSLAEFRRDLDFQQRVAILVALIHGLRPQAVLALESQAGLEVIAQHGESMSRYSGLFAAFASPVPSDLTLRRLQQCLQSLSAVYANAPEWFEELAKRNELGASRDKFRLLPTGAADGEWVSALAQEPGFLAMKKASRS